MPPSAGPKMKPRPKAMPIMPMPRDEEPGESVADAQHRHADGGGGDAPQQHGAAPHAIGQAPPHGDEQELHERVGGAWERRDEVARAEVAREAGQERDDEPEPEQLEEHREKERPERG